MEQNQPQIKSNKSQKNIYQKINKAHKELWATISKSIAFIILFIFFLFGSFSVFDMLFPERIPEVYFIGVRSERDWINKNLNQTLNPELWSELQRLQAMQPSLKLLDLVCPEVSDWYRDQYDYNNVAYDWGNDSAIAKFDFLTRKLILSKQFFFLREGEKAETLAHEYRHSLQNRTKFMKQVVFNILTNELHEEIVEDDANYLELRVHVALYQ